MRKRPPHLVDPHASHQLYGYGELGITTAKTVGERADSLASDKARTTKRPRVAGTILDGVAQQNLLAALEESGQIRDATELGFDPYPEVGREPFIPTATMAPGRLLTLGGFSSLGALVGVGLTANNLYYTPIFVGPSINVDAICFEITTIGGGGDAQCGIYNAGSPIVPTTLVDKSAKTTFGANGVKTLTIGTRGLPGNRWYWLALGVTAAFSVRGSATGPNLPNIRGALVASFTEVVCLMAESLGAGWSNIPDVATPTVIANTYVHLGLRAA
jgi:hypothetical protein